jgi:hypothetical protein
MDVILLWTAPQCRAKSRKIGGKFSRLKIGADSHIFEKHCECALPRGIGRLLFNRAREPIEREDKSLRTTKKELR